MNPRAILHVDMDAFFAALEAAANPALRGKPLIVCGNLGGRGVVCTASYEARKFGIHSAMPVSEARRRCPGGTFVEGNHKLYLDASLRLQAILLRRTPRVEPTSIDEAYLDCSGDPARYGTGYETADRIRREIERDLGVTGSVGVGPNMLLAKMASKLAKPNGVVEIAPDRVPDTLRPLPVGTLPGVGPRTCEILRERGIRTIGDLEQVPRALLERSFGKHGMALWKHARGIDDRKVGEYTDEEPPKTLGHEITFAADLGGDTAIRAALSALADRVASRLRAKALAARRLTLRVRYSDFKTVSRTAATERPYCYDLDLYEFAHALYTQLALSRKGVRLLGITAGDLVARMSVWQPSLFEVGQTERSEEESHKISDAVDSIRVKFGRGAIHRGRTLVG